MAQGIRLEYGVQKVSPHEFRGHQTYADEDSWYKNNIIGGKLWIWGGSVSGNFSFEDSSDFFPGAALYENHQIRSMGAL